MGIIGFFGLLITGIVNGINHLVKASANAKKKTSVSMDQASSDPQFAELGLIFMHNQTDETLENNPKAYKHTFLIRTPPIGSDSYHIIQGQGEVGDLVLFILWEKNPTDKKAILCSIYGDYEEVPAGREDDFNSPIGYLAKEQNRDLHSYLVNDFKYVARIKWKSGKPYRYIIELYSERLIKGARSVEYQPMKMT